MYGCGCRHFDENQVWVLLLKALFEEPESGEEALRERDPQKHSSRTLGVPKVTLTGWI